VERVLEVLRTAPAEQDDRDLEQEGDAESAVRVRDGRTAERLPDDAAAEHDEQQNSCGRRARRDDVAAGDTDVLATHRSLLFPPTGARASSHREMKIILRRTNLGLY